VHRRAKGDDTVIYDTFMFFNELELLELRLHELAGVVDKFVLCEATRTFSNKPKPLYYADNKNRFSAFSDRIIHVVVDDSPDSTDPWVLDHYQKNCIGRALRDCRPDDVILFSDADEIARASTVAQAARELTFDDSALANAMHAAWKSKFATTAFHRFVRKHHPYVRVLAQRMHYYFLNCVCVTEPDWRGTRMLHYRDFTKADEIRYTGHIIVPNGGWHFSFLGGIERIQQKVQAYAHTEFNTPELTSAEHLQKSIEEGRTFFSDKLKFEFVDLDDSYPRYIREHPEKFPGMIKTTKS
jgi:beta-1,4-mannosyl-glycoprotein beta-1,4-N-acetylglucosaminyltransferase